MTPAYTIKLGFIYQKMRVQAHKIDNSILKTYSMALTSLLLKNSLERVQFLKTTFLWANTSITMVLKMLFLSHSIYTFGLI